MTRRLEEDKSLNSPLRNEAIGELQDHFVDQSPSPEAIVVEQDTTDRRLAALTAAIGSLSGRERRIFEARYLSDEPPTLDELADEFRLSPERIRQIEMCAFEKVRRAATTLAVPRHAAAAEIRHCRPGR